ncbi:ORF4 [Dioscorea nummularia-associated virus]|uniref:ORF4 n=1 Tax=Dioscorea nummularia-associated virus TaxID=2303485 RepID=A0A346RP35_9VIRU|nr:ORF4 [Dioscorea nummularia-associated virus]AXS67832.1 ORF4 [Dioscorea nummularia-associated virus]
MIDSLELLQLAPTDKMAENKPADKMTENAAKGKELPQFVEGQKGNFRIPYGLELDNQQKIITNALWRATTSTAKIKALNALCHYFIKETKQDFSYFVIFEGKKAGVYYTWGNLQKAVGKRNTPQGWRGFYTQQAAETAFSQYSKAQQIMPDIQNISVKRDAADIQSAQDNNKEKILEVSKTSKRNMTVLEVGESSQCKIRITEEKETSSEKDRYIQFNKLSTLLHLKRSYRQKWLDNLPREVSQLINNKVKETFYFDLQISQEIIYDLDEQRKEGLEVVQWTGLPVQNSFAPAILMAKVNWAIFEPKPLVAELFFHGMLLLLSLTEMEDIPDFFGPKLQNLLRQYKRDGNCEIHIISELPRIRGNNILPATHHILLSRTFPRWLNYTSGPFNTKSIGDILYYTEYFVNFKGPSDDWELLGETLTAKVWVLHGIASRCRSITSIPGRQAEGFAITQPVNLTDEMDLEGASTD